MGGERYEWTKNAGAQSGGCMRRWVACGREKRASGGTDLERRGAVAHDGRERQHSNVDEVEALPVLPHHAVVLARNV